MVRHSLPGYPHIVRNPKVVGGEPAIAGTRIPVWVIAAAWRINPDVADICRAYPVLTPALVEEALAFAAAHAQEIEEALAANDVETS